MDYAELKKLDEESARKMIEGTGPVDECICSLLAPSGGGKNALSRSLKKVFATIKPGKTKKSMQDRGKVAVVVEEGGAGMGGGGFGGGRGGSGGGRGGVARGGGARGGGARGGGARGVGARGGRGRGARGGGGGGGYPVGAAGIEIPLVFSKGENGKV